MKLYRKLTIAFFMCFVTHVSFCQEGLLSGSLMDQKEESIPFATVAVMQMPDSTLVTGSTTEMDGTFNLKSPDSGKYLLRFSGIGFETVFTPLFEITTSNFSRDFGSFVMQEEMNALNEVMIKTWRPRVKVENGKMVMKVEGTAVASGQTAYDILGRAPGVSVGQNGDFMINGNKGVSVMLDGRLTYLSAKELQTLLESMPAENIEEIEVIQNPSAKYDAEGTAGILNINLKKNAGTGMTGSIYGGYKVSNQELFNAGANLSYNKGNWNSFANLNISERGTYRPQTVVRSFSGNQEFSVYKNQGLQILEELIPSLQAGTDYDLNENHSIGVMANLSHKKTKGTWNTVSSLESALGENYVNVTSWNNMDESYTNGQFNFHYIGKLDTLGTVISADVDYVRLKREENFAFTNTYNFADNNSEISELLDNRRLSDYDIYAAQIDFVKPVSLNSSFEMGLKASKVISNSGLKNYITEDNVRQIDPSSSDRFKYEEEIYAAYLTYNNRFNNIWNLQAGLRAEQTIGEGKSFIVDEKNKREYLKFFPNIMLEQKVGENYKLNYSFSKRISRPNYKTFNPLIFYLDPYTYVEGNPDLQAQITTSFKLGQNFFKKYNLLLSYDSTNDYFIEVPVVNQETGETSFTTRNLKNFTTYGATIVAPVELASFWNVNNTLVLNQQKYDLVLDGQPVENDNLFYMLQSNHQINLPLGIKAEVNGTYRGPAAYGVYNIARQWWVDAGLKKSFFNDRLDVTLNATDIFKGMEMDVNAEFIGNTIQIEQYFDNRSVSLNLRYIFRKSNSNKKVRQNSLEELNRAGGK